MALSPNAALLITVDESGGGLLVAFSRRVILHRFRLGADVSDLRFSPTGAYFAVACGSRVQLWRMPGLSREFAPLVKVREYPAGYGDISSISWRADGNFFLTTGKDLMVRMYSLNPVPGFTPVVLSGHRDAIVGAYWSQDMQSLYSVSRDGAVFQWGVVDGIPSENVDLDSLVVTEKMKERRWRVVAKHFFNQSHAKVTSAAFHVPSSLLTVGFSSGVFGIWELPSFSNIHTLSISQKRLDACAVSPSGDWLAFASAKLGQLLIWEWASESYVLKQQGHYHDVNSLSYSHDGQFIVTGADDGKVKLWNVHSGFCFVTFEDHASAVTHVEFSKKNQVVFSASLDGTVRAYDLIRYRNFRTFTSPTPTGFQALAVDMSGEIVCASSVDSFEIYVWSVQTGKLLDVLSGHNGPVSCLRFSPSQENGNILVSGSWDKTVKVWDIFARGGGQVLETLEHKSDVLAVSFKNDGKVVATATLDGNITFWDVNDGKIVASIEGKKDISGGRKAKDLIAAESNAATQHFTSISYTADGDFIIAGGDSKYVCIYDCASKVLVKRFQTSNNLSLDGMKELLNSKNMTEFGALDLMEDDDYSDLEDRLERDSALPGVRNGDKSLRNVRPEIRTKDVKFSPTGRSWAAASTEGLIIFSLDDSLIFDPVDLEIEITPTSTIEALDQGDYLRALIMAFRLSEQYLIQRVFESIASDSIELVVKDTPLKYLARLLKFIGIYLEKSPHVDFALRWVNAIIKYHYNWIRTRHAEHLPVLRSVHRGLVRGWDELSKVYVSLSQFRSLTV